ncbi:MAG: response regulator [Pirellulales bacterium]|nr:response regulator [Pirellulales bacterium]
MSKKLLIVDDAAIIRKMIRDTVTQSGWEVVGEASNGQEAIELYQELRPDAVTLDIIMPEFNGLHALIGIRECNPNARVIMVSAVDQKRILKEALQLGATDFLVKPFDRNTLIATLESPASSTGKLAEMTAE